MSSNEPKAEAQAEADPDTNEITILIGLSGPSSSGKTTLARLLRDIFRIRSSSDTTDETKPKGENETESEISIELILIHEDDFWKTDAEIPTRDFTSAEHGTRTLQDWDCVDSLDLPFLDRTLAHIRRTGQVPHDLVSKEDQNKVGTALVGPDVVDAYRGEVRRRIDEVRSAITTGGSSRYEKRGRMKRRTRVKVYILDGFLMYPPPPPPPPSHSHTPAPSSTGTQTESNPVPHEAEAEAEAGAPKQEGQAIHLPPLPPSYSATPASTSSDPQHVHLHTVTTSNLDHRLFLPCTRRQAIARRADRSGYVTIEGFWEDPPGYVEDVVWVHYRGLQGWIFGTADGDEDGDIDEAKIGIERENVLKSRHGLSVGPVDVGMVDVLRWGVDVVWDVVRERLIT